MNEIGLPVKYAILPLEESVESNTTKTKVYIVAKCYLVEGTIKYDLDGSIKSCCKIIPCKDINKAIVNNSINPEYIKEVSCVFNDLDLATEERNKVNDLLIQKLKEVLNEQEILDWKSKVDKMVKSMEKMRSISEKKYVITSQNDKKLIYSKEK